MKSKPVIEEKARHEKKVILTPLQKYMKRFRVEDSETGECKWYK